MTAGGALCTMEERSPRRTRRRCPFHECLHYGWLRFYYDTVRVFFDCGTLLDFGYGYWQRPRRALIKAGRGAG